MRPLPSGGSASRILIVDDDLIVSDTFSRILRLEGHEVWAAVSGEDGLRLAQRHIPDAIVLDLRMPAASGLRILRALRALPSLQATPVAIITGDYRVSADVAREIAGFGASLRYKPLWLDELVTLARDMVTVPVTD